MGDPQQGSPIVASFFLLKFGVLIEKSILIYLFLQKYVRRETSLGYGMGALSIGVTGDVMRWCVEGFKVEGELGRREEGRICLI